MDNYFAVRINQEPGKTTVAKYAIGGWSVKIWILCDSDCSTMQHHYAGEIQKKWRSGGKSCYKTIRIHFVDSDTLNSWLFENAYLCIEEMDNELYLVDYQG